MVCRLQQRRCSGTLAIAVGPLVCCPSSGPGAASMWVVLLLVALLAGRPGPLPGPEPLPRATVLVDSGAHQLVIQLPPVDVPAAGSGGEAMVGLPLCQVLVPVDASLHSSRVELVDGSGRLLPHEMLHHFNLSDPDRRELFLPISLHLSPRAGRPRRSP